ncbi:MULTISPECIES: hypothetical protein [Comamonas]|uniref:hypothetical protein n=1 Tax=Comamonas TaxID=283 RepID=UPI0012EC144D|nr:MULTISPECIES: hypothetical protein [Comamonas]
MNTFLADQYADMNMLQRNMNQDIAVGCGEIDSQASRPGWEFRVYPRFIDSFAVLSILGMASALQRETKPIFRSPR